jgi:hypothetical protein
MLVVLYRGMAKGDGGMAAYGHGLPSRQGSDITEAGKRADVSFLCPSSDYRGCSLPF